MQQEKKYYSNYHKYREFWQNNLQGIDSITKNLENDLFKLEKKYSDFESIYDEIMDQIDILSSIYSNFNSIQGQEYILSLKSLLKEYKKKHTHDGMNFNAIYYLHSKISELTNNSINKFPKLNHSSNIYTENNKKIETHLYTNRYTNRIRPHKWITFFRNGSWFITPYMEIQIVKFNDAEIFSSYESDTMFIKIDGKLLEVIDLFSKSPEWCDKHITYFLIITQNVEIKCYAVNKIGKKILAKKNFIKAALKPFKKKNLISSGCLRLFGKNHIYI